MPQLQVIERQMDPSAQLAIQTSQNIAQNIRQKQASQIALLEMQQRAKLAKSEEQKALLERKKTIFETSLKMKEQGFDGAMIMKGLSNLYGKDVWPALAEGGKSMEEFANLMGDSPGTPEDQLKGAQTSKAVAETGTQERINTMLDNQTRGAAVGGNATPSSSGMVMSDLNVGGMKLTNLAGRTQEIQAEERAKAGVKAEPFVKQYKVFKANYYDGLSEIGGLPQMAGEAKVKGFLEGVGAEFNDNTAVQSSNRLRKAVALSLANIANGGRASDKDAEAILPAIPDYTVPQATAESLFEFLEAGLPGLSLENTNEKDRGKKLKDFSSLAVTTILERDKRRVRNFKSAYPNATEADINTMLQAFRERENGAQ